VLKKFFEGNINGLTWRLVATIVNLRCSLGKMSIYLCNSKHIEKSEAIEFGTGKRPKLGDGDSGDIVFPD